MGLLSIMGSSLTAAKIAMPQKYRVKVHTEPLKPEIISITLIK